MGDREKPIVGLCEPAGQKPVDIVAIGHAQVLQINRRITRALAQKGWRIELVIPARLPWTSDPAALQEDHPDDVPIHRLEPIGRNTRTWSFAGLSDLLDARRPRILYLENEPDSRMAGALGRWCKNNEAQLVVNTNENDIPPVLGALFSRGLKPALRSLRTRLWMRLKRPNVSHVVAICEDGREAMRTIGFGDAVTVAPLGFDRSLFFPDESRGKEVRDRLGLHGPVIAYFGRLAPNKGVHLLIAALGRIKNLEWQFLIDDFSHSSENYAQLLTKAIAEAGIKDRTVSFSAKHDEMPDFMRAADIVVVPSIWKEQYGRVAPEAMACGRAVIVSDIGTLPELIGTTGIAVPPGNIDALADTLQHLLNAPEERQRLGAKAAARAHEFLSIDRQADLLDQLFKRLLHECDAST